MQQSNGVRALLGKPVELPGFQAEWGWPNSKKPPKGREGERWGGQHEIYNLKAQHEGGV